MSDAPEVDLSQIRGDWFFHMNFLSNAMDRTLERAEKMLHAVRGDVGDDIAGRLTDINETWGVLRADKDEKGSVNIKNPLFDEFFAKLERTKELCDALELEKGLSGSSSIYDNELEHFTEAMRQARCFTPDFIMMREQRPA